MIFRHVLLFSLLNVVPTVFSDDAPSPGQPQDAGQPGTFKIIGESVVSAQQAFLGTTDKVYFIDTTEANPATEGGHPAWASEYSLSENKGRAMDTITSFCAGGGVLGNGTWVNVGGHIQVAHIGGDAEHEDGGSPSFNIGSSRGLRLLNPCDDENCEWRTTANLSTDRLYPAVETLEDGTLFIIGGCTSNVFVNNASTNNPTYEIFPALSSFEPNGTYDSSRSVPKPTFSPFLNDTLPANLYPVTFLLPSGRLLIQANRKTAVVDRHAGTEELLDDVPDAVRTHPASAGAVLLPLTPRNRWEATIMLCGGSDVKDDQWGNNLAQVPTSKSCVQLTPDVSGQYQHVDALPEGRVMGNFILLPTGQIMLLNGAGSGVAGIGNTSWSVGQSYADHPILEPVLYDPEASKGQRWSRSGLSASTIPRMYLSSAVLLPDGAILVAGSNPNFNYTDSTSAPYRTEHRLEKLYPAYFSRRRPEPRGLPNRLEYGGSWFDIELTPDDYFNDKNLDSAKVVVMRTGFSTHAQNMGQRMLELESTMSMNNGSVAIMHVAQITPNPAVFPPGPALLFVVVDGVPSVGVMITVGSGKLGPQDVTAPAQLPPGIASASHIASAKSPAGGWKRPSSVERMVGMCVAGALSALFA